MSTRSIRDVIAHRQPVTVARHTSVRKATRLMTQHETDVVLVVDGGELVGIFDARDVVRRVLAIGANADRATVAEVMTSDPVRLSSDAPLNHALHLMHEGGFQHVPIVDEGRVVGVISARDALGRAATEFEDELKARQGIAERMR
jgi:CBS domain-containing protein